jgi:hypothetical protein
MGFHHLSTPPTSLEDTGQRPEPPVKRARGLPTADKHCLLRALGSGGIMRLTQRDVAVGTHARLIVSTRVWNPSHRHLT